MYSVDTDEEAHQLIVACCEYNRGEPKGYIARELAQEQTIENLDKFADRLHTMYQRLHPEKFDQEVAGTEEFP